MVTPPAHEEHLEDGLAEGFDVVRELAGIVESATSTENYLRVLPSILAANFRSPLAGLTYDLGSFALRETFSDEFDSCSSWEGPLGSVILEAEARQRTFARVYDTEDGELLALCALPVRLKGVGAGGAVGLLLRVSSREVASSMLAELRALVGLFEFGMPDEWAGRGRAKEPSIRQELHSLGKATGYANLHELAFAITNNLRTKADCEQVVLSEVARGHVRVLSISGIDEPNPRAPGILEMTQAQEECLDHGAPIFAQEVAEWEEGESSRFRLHAQWRTAANGANVGSIPLMAGDEVVAVLSVRRGPTHLFSRDEIAACRDRVEPFARAIEVMRRADRSVAEHTVESARHVVTEVLAPDKRVRRVALGFLAVVLLWFLFGSIGVRRAMVARVAAREVVHLTAPFQAAIHEVHVEQGEHVVAGQVLATMDVRELELERAELEAERASVRVEIDQHLAAGDVVQADLARSRERVVQARLASLARRTEAAVVCAPEAGIIVRGDLRERTGDVVPQGEPLFELVGHDSLRIELDVPEEYVDELAAGAELRFAPNAAPERARDGVVEIVGAAAEVRDGQNVFRSMAGFAGEQELDWLRVGMEGVAKVEAGRRPVRSIALERVTQAIYQSLWL